MHEGVVRPYLQNSISAVYNALQAQLKETVSHGLLFAFVHLVDIPRLQSDPYSNSAPNFHNLRPAWGPSDYNRTHLFVFSGVYALPVGRGSALLPDAGRFTRALLGGWSVGTIVTLDSGAPFYATAGGDVANTGGPNRRAQRSSLSPYTASRSHTQYLDKTMFSAPAAYTFGNESRNDLVRPTYKNVDLNLSKTFPLAESLKLQFPAESFNIYNKTNYSTPDGNVQSGTFGQTLSSAGPGRQLQFALKALF